MMKARASATRRAMPSDSRVGNTMRTSARPISASQRAILASLAASSANTSFRLSSTVSQGKRRGSWNT